MQSPTITGGISYADLKQYDRAIQDFNKAIELDPQYASPYFNKACAYALQNSLQEAIHWLRKTLEMNSEEYCLEAKKDSDLDSIRDTPAFKALMDEFCQNC